MEFMERFGPLRMLDHYGRWDYFYEMLMQKNLFFQPPLHPTVLQSWPVPVSGTCSAGRDDWTLRSVALARVLWSFPPISNKIHHPNHIFERISTMNLEKHQYLSHFNRTIWYCRIIVYSTMPSLALLCTPPTNPHCTHSQPSHFPIIRRIF